MDPESPQRETISVVIPAYNEEGNIDELVNRLNTVTSKMSDFKWYYLFVDDGSQDNTFYRLKENGARHGNIRILRLSRNFGAHIAVSAGIENATSDAVICTGADLQEPLELMEKLVAEWKKGFQVVWTIRKHRAQSLVGKTFSLVFSKVFRFSSGLRNYPKEGPSGYFLIDKKVAELWGRFSETNRAVGGMLAWLGFKQSVVEYEQAERYSGRSTYSFMKLVKIAIDTFVSFSYLPIRVISYLGIFVSLVSFCYAILLIIGKIFFGIGPLGWASVMVIVLLLGGVQLVTLGILGEYIWRGVDESRRRPLYIIMEDVDFEKEG